MKSEPKSADTQHDSFGRYLQSVRQERGIDLKTVAADTRIRVDLLEKIETEDHQGLPNEAFVKGFLRTYAKAVGADGDRAVELYESRLRMIRQLSKSETDLKQAGQRFWLRLLFSLGLIIVLMIASVYGISLYQNRPANQAASTAVHSSGGNTADVEESGHTAAGVEQEVASAPEETQPSDYLLRIKSIEETWMQVKIDNQKPTEYNLNPGDFIELKAQSQFQLLVGNAGGVQLTLNDQPVQVPGERGQVTSLQLP